MPVAHFGLRLAVLGRQLVGVFAYHGLELVELASDRALGFVVGLGLFDHGLAGGVLELHRVFAGAGDVGHRLPFKARGLVNLEVGVVHAVVGRGILTRQILLKRGVEVLVDAVGTRAPAVAFLVLERLVRKREAAERQYQHQRKRGYTQKFVHNNAPSLWLPQKQPFILKRIINRLYLRSIQTRLRVWRSTA